MIRFSFVVPFLISSGSINLLKSLSSTPNARKRVGATQEKGGNVKYFVLRAPNKMIVAPRTSDSVSGKESEAGHLKMVDGA